MELEPTLGTIPSINKTLMRMVNVGSELAMSGVSMASSNNLKMKLSRKFGGRCDGCNVSATRTLATLTGLNS